jgi:hypothetical protein
MVPQLQDRGAMDIERPDFKVEKRKKQAVIDRRSEVTPFTLPVL